MKKYLQFFPHIFLALSGLVLILAFPGGFGDDAGQYDTLARSILHGRYELIVGQATMYREPGYPIFRALVYALGGNPTVILFVQLALLILTVEIWRRVWKRIAPEYGWIGPFGVLLAYGYWTMVRMNGYELLLGFLVSVIILSAIVFVQRRTWPSAILCGTLLGYLAVTRGVYLFLWMPIIGVLAWNVGRTGGKERRRTVLQLIVIVALALIIPGSWMMRNQIRFHTFSIASRPGIVLNIRAIQADSPWKALTDSYASIVFGERFAQALFPNWSYANTFYWPRLQEKIDAYARESDNTDQVDAMLLRDAKRVIFQDPLHTAKYIAWSSAEVLRLYALPSWRYPQTSVETTFRGAGQLGLFQTLYLIAAACLQLTWLVGAVAGCVIGMRRWKRLFLLIVVPSLYLLIIHAGLDNIVRFSAPVQPILGACVLCAAARIMQSKKKSSSRG
ncbi:MAG: hypothetical protein WC477_00185 [Patescibacteria group bacterium]